MNKSKRVGFTLVELLVVVAIIAMLLAVLIPTLRRAQGQAKSVICRNNVKQWGVMLSMYSNDYEGHYMPGFTSDVPAGTGGMWMIRLRPYYQGVDKIRLCPKATKILSREGGGMDNTTPFTAWGVYGDPGYFSPDGPDWDHQAHDYGSYGVNGWIHDVPEGTVNRDNYWRTKDRVKVPSIVPAFGDSVWEGTIVYGSDPPPSVPARNNSPGRDGMFNFFVPRHGLFVNFVFLDNSARKISLKQLYKQQWSPTFQTGYKVDWRSTTWMSKDWGN
jgi:prepilin-type N-terminal cleavage/methylation domain-containing protein